MASAVGVCDNCGSLSGSCRWAMPDSASCGLTGWLSELRLAAALEGPLHNRWFHSVSNDSGLLAETPLPGLAHTARVWVVPKTMTTVKWYCWMDSVFYYIILTITINRYPYSKFLLDFPALISESVLSPSYGLSLEHFHISRSSANKKYFPFCSRHFRDLFFYFLKSF